MYPYDCRANPRFGGFTEAENVASMQKSVTLTAQAALLLAEAFPLCESYLDDKEKALQVYHAQLLATFATACNDVIRRRLDKSPKWFGELILNMVEMFAGVRDKTPLEEARLNRASAILARVLDLLYPTVK